MSVGVRVVLIIGALLSSIYSMDRIRKSKMRISESIYWFGFTMMILVLALFPQVGYALANVLGIEAPINLVYLVIIFLLLTKVFLQSMEISHLRYQIESIAQKIAIYRKQEERKQ